MSDESKDPKGSEGGRLTSPTTSPLLVTDTSVQASPPVEEEPVQENPVKEEPPAEERVEKEGKRLTFSMKKLATKSPPTETDSEPEEDNDTLVINVGPRKLNSADPSKRGSGSSSGPASSASTKKGRGKKRKKQLSFISPQLKEELAYLFLKDHQVPHKVDLEALPPEEQQEQLQSRAKLVAICEAICQRYNLTKSGGRVLRYCEDRVGGKPGRDLEERRQEVLKELRMNGTAERVEAQLAAANPTAAPATVSSPASSTSSTAVARNTASEPWWLEPLKYLLFLLAGVGIALGIVAFSR